MSDVGNTKARRLIDSRGGFLLFLCAMVILGFLSQFQWIGQVLIAAYAVIALWRRVPARRTFMYGLWSLGMVPLAIIVGNWVIAQNFAAYTFILFAVGVVHMVVDLQREISLQK